MLCSAVFPPEEGIGNYVNNLSKMLTEQGHQVTIITRGGLTAGYFNFDGIKVHKVPFLMVYPFHVDVHGVFVNRLLRDLKGEIDLVHVHTPLTPSISAQVPIMTTFHTPHFADYHLTDLVDLRYFLTRALAIFDYRIEKSLIDSSSVISAVSEGVRQDLARYYGIDFEKITVLGNAVDQVFLEAGDCSRKKDDLLILYVGRLDYRKGVLDLIESMKTVTRRVPKARLVIIGKGPLVSKVIRRISDLKLWANVEMKGFVSKEEVLEAYMHASVFVLPSFYEGLPTVSLEAMACKDAVVATAVRGNLDVVKPGYTGLLVPQKDPISLANAIIYLLEHPDQREELAHNARKLVEDNFTWDKVTERVLKAYAAILR